MNSYDRIYTLLTESKVLKGITPDRRMSGATRSYRKQRRASTRHNVKARALDDKASAIEQKRNPDWPSLGYLATTLRKKHSTHKRLGIKLFAKALKNKKIIPQSVERGVTRMKARELEEGESTGGEGTAERLGKWYKDIAPKAKPGKKGYMRKRNVPRPGLPEEGGEEYDPTKHKAPERGKPLRYMKPQHRDMTIARINTRIKTIATKNAERRGGSTNVRHAETKKGKNVLDKYGVPRPSVAQMVTKWIKGNNPKSKDNPEGYVRSDKK